MLRNITSIKNAQNFVGKFVKKINDKIRQKPLFL